MTATLATAQEPKWAPHIDFEAKPGTDRSLGEADLFVPLWQDSRSLLFGNLRGRFDDGDGREGNLGLGLRRMLESGWNIGGYGYLDRRKTENGNYFDQATLGGEALGRDWDFRANAYLPYGDKVRDLGTASTASVSGSTVLVSSVTSEERALKGYDAEVGWRLPFFDADAARQLRVYAGGYRFKDEVTKVSGPRVRIEFAMAEVPGLWSGAQLMVSAEAQDDDVRGSQSFLSLRLRVPLGGKEPSRRVGYQERRMTAPVVRDVDIVAPVIASAPVIETATALAGGQAFTVINSSTTPNLGTAVAALANNTTALLSGTFNVSGGTAIDLGGSKSLIAGTMTVRTSSGLTATLSSPATILSTANRTIQAPGSNTISGLTINVTGAGSGSPIAIALNDTGANYNILNNTITMTQIPGGGLQGISAPGNANLVISGNSFVLRGGSGSAALLLSGATSGGPVNLIATITGNTLDVSGAAGNNRAVISLPAGGGIGGVLINAGSTGNVLVSGTCTGTPTSGSIGFTNGTTCP